MVGRLFKKVHIMVKPPIHRLIMVNGLMNIFFFTGGLSDFATLTHITY